MRTTIALVFLLISTSYDLFSANNCPVNITRAERHSNSEPAIMVEYKNVSEKEIVGVALGVRMYGEDGTMKPLFFELRDREQMAPGEKTEGSWAETMYHDDFPRVSVFVKKVKFSDLTEWKDDGSAACNSGYAGATAKDGAHEVEAVSRKHPPSTAVTANGARPHGSK